MKLFFSYLKRHVKIIVAFVLFALIFAAVFSLYELPVEAVLYSSVLCLSAGAVLFAFGFYRYVRRHRLLVSLRNRITVSLEWLPPPKGELEEDYQELLRILRAEVADVSSASEIRHREMADYYSLWAHQIKTPISAMRLLLQSDVAGNDSALAAELLKIEQYVEMVLSYVRLESETNDLLLRRVPLDDLIRQSVRKYSRLFILRKLPLDFTETGLCVLTDEKWLSFVIGQVLSNALKYTQRGRISIYAEGEMLVISDTGIGIRAEDIPRVFEKGFTGYNGREDRKSTGIGLYLCRRVCEKLGHTISIESVFGQGTTVRIGLDSGEPVLE